MGLYAITIFLSAFLLFQVQPLIGKYILPWFGGGPAVWTTCMLFFQAALLGGYAYAHLVRTHLTERRQALVHLVLIMGAMALLPIAPSAEWKPEGAEYPVWRILLVLGASVGLPYFALSATSPLLQAWFSVTYPGRSPYRLYALSNVGSLLALASYPFLIEPALRLKTQAIVWSVGFVAFVVLCAFCAIRLRRAGAPGVVAGEPRGAAGTETRRAMSSADPPRSYADPPRSAFGLPRGADDTRPGARTWFFWLALPACGSVMLLAVTNQMCMDVGVVPFLWVLPLSLYLVSFILCFNSDRAYQRTLFWPWLVVSAGVVILLLLYNVEVPMLWQIFGYSTALFACCMVCHGELARLKPAPRHLTAFYLTSSAGGALGGLLVAVVAPLVFSAYFELHVGLWACMVLALFAFWHEKAPRERWQKRWAAPVFIAGCLLVEAAVGTGLLLVGLQEVHGSLASSRNFYGMLNVEEYNVGDGKDPYRILRHGRILHGAQYLTGPLRRKPIKYYWENTGVGLAILNRRPQGPVKVGVVGLGAGMLAAYGRPGDVFRFYEINPEVETLAKTWFSYLADSGARCDIVLGDARVSLERELDRGTPQGYDVLALDAFSSDAIPVHLLTKEAFETYLRHLKPDGILAVHISNRFLDLEPVVLAQADHFGLAAAVFRTQDHTRETPLYYTWILVTRDAAFLDLPAIHDAAEPPEECSPMRRLWTDDYSNLYSILR